MLVVNQKAKLIEINNEYAISDQHGNQIGAVRQVGQSTAKKVMRVLTSYDQFMTHKLQIVDAQGTVVMQLTRPAKVMKSKVIVQDGGGAEIGTVVQENMVGKIRFGLMVGGERIGSINGENWRAWNWNIQDQQGEEVARITKSFGGLARAVFTAADNYVVQIHRPLQDPLRLLVVAAALSVDTALKQDARVQLMASFDAPIGTVRALVAVALAEDLTPLGDLSAALLPPSARAEARIVARRGRPRRSIRRHRGVRPGRRGHRVHLAPCRWRPGRRRCGARRGVRSAGLGAHRGADRAQPARPPQRDRHGDPCLRRRRRPAACGTPARPRRASVPWRRPRSVPAAGATTEAT